MLNTFKMQARSNTHCFAHNIPVTIIEEKEYGYVVTEQERTQALDYLRQNNADLIKGDLIIYEGMAGYRNEGVEIFNGRRIIPLISDYDDYGSLPKEFHVIENNIPIKYWYHDHDNGTIRGIDHNNIVWFNHSLVRDECLQKIKHEFISGKWTIYTTFTFNDIEYRIILADYIDDNEYDNYNPDTYELGSAADINDCIQRFIELLQQDEIVFETWSEFFIEDDHTLYITGTWTLIDDEYDEHDGRLP